MWVWPCGSTSIGWQEWETQTTEGTLFSENLSYTASHFHYLPFWATGEASYWWCSVITMSEGPSCDHSVPVLSIAAKVELLSTHGCGSESECTFQPFLQLTGAEVTEFWPTEEMENRCTAFWAWLVPPFLASGWSLSFQMEKYRSLR